MSIIAYPVKTLPGVTYSSWNTRLSGYPVRATIRSGNYNVDQWDASTRLTDWLELISDKITEAGVKAEVGGQICLVDVTYHVAIVIHFASESDLAFFNLRFPELAERMERTL